MSSLSNNKSIKHITKLKHINTNTQNKLYIKTSTYNTKNMNRLCTTTKKLSD